MKRYYLSPIVGSGGRLPDGTRDPQRPKLADLLDAAGVPRAYTSLIPINDSTGLPLFSWCLVVVDAPNHTPVLAAADVDAMPAVDLDVKWGAIGLVARNLLKSKLQARGFTVSELGGLDNADGYRDILRAIGRKLDPTFDENAFDANLGV